MFSIKELFRIGRGPSSSHTMGPEKACVIALKEFPQVDSVKVVLSGSLAKTGRGHRTDYAIENVFGKIPLEIVYNYKKKDLSHPNTMQIIGYLNGAKLYEKTVHSIGGGEIEFVGETNRQRKVVYKERTFADIARICKINGMTLPEYVQANEGEKILEYLQLVWRQMKDTIQDGLKTEGVIPGGLGVKRKAQMLFEEGIKTLGYERNTHILTAYAYSVSEQNASGGTIVTAPTCGAAGVLPAVLYFKQQEVGYSDEEIIDALKVAGMIGNLVKTNASISGAECGCQAEIGTACAMAAAAVAQLKCLNIKQIECAAEIAMEHHLGLTCDPVMGLVQIPCIERNAVAALRALDAVSLAEMIYEERKISFDMIIKTMYETGKDMSAGYRETSESGLAKLYNK